MSDDHMKADTYKRQRVQRLGRYIALILVPGVIIWIGLGVYLAERMESLNRALVDSRKQLEAMAMMPALALDASWLRLTP